ncbi:hypothetical protein BU16DRAFT_563783 [Lophium mytilinum]|uniref:Uncharacterized protein n=1 Tax=Lophium mytilinum TaxID=390894 RepID=A0A6A6QMM5_9PEZI|nr:hypothetical protein BU16DRAFT_563783 [Lophium mytilinum]
MTPQEPPEMCLLIAPLHSCRHRPEFPLSHEHKPSYIFCKGATRLPRRKPCADTMTKKRETGTWCPNCERYLVDSLRRMDMLQQAGDGELELFLGEQRQRRKARYWRRLAQMEMGEGSGEEGG